MLTVNGLPSGAVFESQAPVGGLSRSRFVWTPTTSQVGRYDVTFSATDGSLTTTQSVVIQVTSTTDTDGDGLLDSWEIDQFGNLDQDGSGDADGDGVSDYDEFIQGSNPNLPDVPLAPVIMAPLNAATLSSFSPDFVVMNSVYDGPLDVFYQFELSRQSDFSDSVDAYYAQPEGSAGQTQWRSALALEEDQTYFWRVRAATAYVQSPWSQASFVVNTENQLPSAPTIVAPANNAVINETLPLFVVDNGIDPDGEALEYLFFVYADAAGSTVVDQVTITEGDGGRTLWQVDEALTDGNDYFWQVAVRDASGTLVETAINRFSVAVDSEPLATLTVNSTGDERDQNRGDGLCATASGVCTLRAAIDEANALDGKENIYFNIPLTDAGCDSGSGVCTIRPTTTYTITERVNIDGYTQPGSSMNTQGAGEGLNTALKIVVHGERTGTRHTWLFGFRDHRGSSLQGMAITNTWDGYDYRGGAVMVYRQDDSDEPGHQFTGLFIGTDETGVTTVGNLDRSVHVVLADDVTIGGIEPEKRNLLMTTKRGIYVKSAERPKVQGNIIGLDITGENPAGMLGSNVYLMEVTGALVGSLEPGGRNTLSGGASSVALTLHTSDDNQIYNNSIGTTVTEQGLPESSRGIYLYDSSRNDVQKNVVSASNHGVFIRRLKESTAASANSLKGNLIGINASGELLNAGAIGIQIRSVDNQIGGVQEGEGNVITNYGRGILVHGELFPSVMTTGNLISGNHIYGNSLLGIDLRGNYGVTQNDALDLDSGGNRLQNFPVINEANTEFISGELRSQANRSYRVELFVNSNCFAGGHGEGEVFLTYIDVVTDENGVANFSYSTTLEAGQLVTATATDRETNDTSEFSECYLVTEVDQLATFTVDSTADDSDQAAGDGVCATGSGVCTLRAAIEEANAFAGKENIHFNIPMSDAGCDASTQVCTIQPEASYRVYEAVNIDGYTQQGAFANTLTTDQGLNTQVKLVVHGNGPATSSSVFDFRDHRGSSLKGMAVTKTWTDRASYGAVLSVYRQDDSMQPGHQFSGLLIGTDEQGLVTVGNSDRSIIVQGAASDVQIGGTEPADRNLMMTARDGIHIRHGSGHRIAGNIIGLDIDGINSVGMTQSMIGLGDLSRTQIGGVEPGSRNILSGSQTAWAMTLANTSELLIQSNAIGVTPQEQAIETSTRGIYLLDSSSNTVKSNVISTKTYTGISINSWQGQANDNIVQGNYIGVNSAGDDLSAGEYGISVKGLNNTIGGASNINDGNTIANYRGGVGLFSVDASQGLFSTGNRILGNSIYNNRAIGIDLDIYSVAANDDLDVDAGNNGLQNFPVIDDVSSQSISGTLHSEANIEYRIEFFENSACSPSEQGQGQQYLGFTTVTTDNDGNANFNHGRQSLAAGVFVSATATNLTTGNTSEFSICVENSND